MQGGYLKMRNTGILVLMTTVSVSLSPFLYFPCMIEAIGSGKNVRRILNTESVSFSNSFPENLYTLSKQYEYYPIPHPLCIVGLFFVLKEYWIIVPVDTLG
ncbi:MAG: hypothetical protein Pg6B_09550 [Candidatus Azobacteroides pseudotrichonymphae]|nr:MAG: hypothetical protein Pg6B_09550 [Candidatus Azobacteroides pseudotrichonymphae]